MLVKNISVVFEINSTNRSSADTNLDTFWFYQKTLINVARLWSR